MKAPVLPSTKAAKRPAVQRAVATRPGRAGARPATRATSQTSELDVVFSSVARYFGLLADPTRLKILHALCQAEQSVSAIVRATGATQTNVSHHLALLHQAGVVARRRDGSTVYYHAAAPELLTVCRAVCVQIVARIDAGEPLRSELLDFAGGR